jgi:hypothetical protein
VTSRVFGADGGGDFGKRGAKIVEAGAGGRADGNDRSAFEKRAVHELLDFESREIADVGIREIGLGERDHAMTDAEKAADFEVLTSLRLNGFVGRDDQHHQIDAGCAREHVFYESFMAGNVDEFEIAEMGEAEVDGDAAALFFLEAIGVDAGERADERGLAVIDVPGGADDDVMNSLHERIRGLDELTS